MAYSTPSDRAIAAAITLFFKAMIEHPGAQVSGGSRRIPAGLPSRVRRPGGVHVAEIPRGRCWE